MTFPDDREVTPARTAPSLRRTVVVGLLAAAALLAPVAGAAAAAAATVAAPAAAALPALAPMRLTQPVTDPTGILGPEQRTAITTQLDELAGVTRFELYVVLVPGFDGASGQAWAEQAGAASGFGRTQLVLAIAPDDRLFGIGADAGAVPADVVSQMKDDITAALRSDLDYVAAVRSTVKTLTAVDHGTFASADGSTVVFHGDLGTFVVPVFLILVVVVVIVVVRSHRSRTRGPGGRPLPNLDDLRTRAGSALVAADDAVKSSTEELAFAKAQFGLQATDQFTAAVDAAREDVRKAFSIQQLLDDEIPEPDHVKSQMLTDILALCERASTTLTAQEAAFQQLRDIQSRLPEHVAELEQRIAEVRAHVQTSRVALTELGRRYPPSALASIAANPDQATQLLDGAAESVLAARADITADDRPTAVIRTRAAQLAVGQAAQLLDAVDNAGTELESAAPRLAQAVASITADVTDAERLAHADPTLAPLVSRARAAITQGREAQTTGDPLAALRELTAAEAAIDAALAPLRAADEQIQRATAMLGQTISQADALIRATNDFIDTRRGAVGPTARTRLAEAFRHQQLAVAYQPNDPQRALDEAQRALELARSARDIAQSDVDNGGGFGTGQNNVGGMILGGIILDSLLRGGRNGGGFGGSSFDDGSFFGGGSSFGGGGGGGSFGGGSSYGGGGGGGSF